jgi:hypothetical protein
MEAEKSVFMSLGILTLEKAAEYKLQGPEKFSAGKNRANRRHGKASERPATERSGNFATRFRLVLQIGCLASR